MRQAGPVERSISISGVVVEVADGAVKVATPFGIVELDSDEKFKPGDLVSSQSGSSIKSAQLPSYWV